jgi:hypothetical protein
VVCITAPISLSSRDFTLEKYQELCRVLQEDYTICTVREYLSGKPEGKTAILRHDIDRKIQNAVRMAKLEQEMGIHSSYYFRYPYTFNPEILRKIQGFGHEIGYHYEVLSKTNGDYPKAIALFQTELEAFRKICPVDTICMHGKPLSSLNNRDLWKQYDFSRYGLLGEAFLSIGTVDYFTDTGRNWNGRNNMSDFVGTVKSLGQPDTTDDLIRLIRGKKFPVLYLTTHPERWASNIFEWVAWSFLDFGMNCGKIVLTRVRK